MQIRPAELQALQSCCESDASLVPVQLAALEQDTDIDNHHRPDHEEESQPVPICVWVVSVKEGITRSHWAASCDSPSVSGR